MPQRRSSTSSTQPRLALPPIIDNPHSSTQTSAAMVVVEAVPVTIVVCSRGRSRRQGCAGAGRARGAVCRGGGAREQAAVEDAREGAVAAALAGHEHAAHAPHERSAGWRLDRPHACSARRLGSGAGVLLTGLGVLPESCVARTAIEGMVDTGGCESPRLNGRIRIASSAACLQLAL